MKYAITFNEWNRNEFTLVGGQNGCAMVAICLHSSSAAVQSPNRRSSTIKRLLLTWLLATFSTLMHQQALAIVGSRHHGFNSLTDWESRQQPDDDDTHRQHTRPYIISHATHHLPPPPFLSFLRAALHIAYQTIVQLFKRKSKTNSYCRLKWQIKVCVLAFPLKALQMGAGHRPAQSICPSS